MNLPTELPSLWRAALDWWSQSIDLALPEEISDPNGPLAFINLATRKTRVHFQRLKSVGCEEHLPCVLTHEVGHHIRYPHTTQEARRMQRFLREICGELFLQVDLSQIGDRYDGLLNLFFDLLINDELSRDFEASFVAIYRATTKEPSLSFGFYLGLYEELWSLEQHALVQEPVARELAAVEPHWRARARTTGEFLRAHPENRPLQLARFLVAIRPFVLADAKANRQCNEAFERESLGGACESADDASDLLRPRSDEEAARRWLREQTDPTGKEPPKRRTAPKETGGNPLIRARQQLQGLVPPDLAALIAYRTEADRAPLELPASIEPGEPLVFGPHEAWELGDEIEDLDWLGSIARAGTKPIPGMTTVVRTRLPEEPRPGDREIPWIELYIDSSGSMPNPQIQFSHQILAGFILARAAARAGGRIRVLQYSSVQQRIFLKDFVRASLPAERALLEYIGGGTDFPWDELSASVQRWKHIARVRRVVISDGDFLHNFAQPTPKKMNPPQILQAAHKAGGITALLNINHRADELVRAGVHVIPVASWESLGAAARALADALFRVKEETR